MLAEVQPERSIAIRVRSSSSSIPPARRLHRSRAGLPRARSSTVRASSPSRCSISRRSSSASRRGSADAAPRRPPRTVDARREGLQLPEALLQPGDGPLGLGGVRRQLVRGGQLGPHLVDRLLEGAVLDELGREPCSTAWSSVASSACLSRSAASSATLPPASRGDPSTPGSASLPASVAGAGQLGLGRRPASSTSRSIRSSGSGLASDELVARAGELGAEASRDPGRARSIPRPSAPGRRCELGAQALQLVGEVLHPGVELAGALAELAHGRGRLLTSVLQLVGELVDASVRLGGRVAELVAGTHEVARASVLQLVGELVDASVRLGGVLPSSSRVRTSSARRLCSSWASWSTRPSGSGVSAASSARSEARSPASAVDPPVDGDRAAELVARSSARSDVRSSATRRCVRPARESRG